MSEQVQAVGPARVSDDRIWRYTKFIFATAALIFLVTITLGFLNVFTTGDLPRWQFLMHIHSAHLGWKTLGVFGATVWLFTGDRAVSDAYVDRVRWLALAMVVAFVGLIASFGIAFSQGGDAFYLLAAFGPLAALTIWAAAVFFLRQLGQLSEVTTAHLLTAAGFLVLAISVTFAVVLALGHAGVLAVPDFARPGHVFGTFGYEILVLTGVLEWLVLRERGRWTRVGALQVGLGVLVGTGVPLVVLLVTAGLPDGPVNMLGVVSILASFVLFGLVFLGRVGWRALRTNPLSAGVDAWTFLATVWFAVSLVWFFLQFALGNPSWWRATNAHLVGIGITTNLLFGVLTARTRSGRVGDPWAQPLVMLLINGGVVLFIVLFITTGSKLGALVMGSGLLLGVGWMLVSLREAPSETDAAAETNVEPTD